MTKWNQILTTDVIVAARSTYGASSNKFIIMDSSFLSSLLSELTHLKSIDAISTFTNTALKLAGINQKVSQ
jgi:hypothetical protein